MRRLSRGGFLLFLLLSLHCTKGRAPGPLVVWLNLNSEEAARLTALAEEYSDDHSVPIRLEIKTDRDVRNYLRSADFAAAGPDLLELSDDQVTGLLGKMQLLNPIRRESTEWPSFIYTVWAPGVLEDKIYFLPWRLSWSAMIYDSSAVPDPPTTWKEWLGIAQANPGRIGLRGLNAESLERDLLPLIWAAGGDPFDFGNAGTLRAFEFLSELGPTLNLSTRAFDEASLAEAAAAGQVILHFNTLPAAQALAREGSLPNPLKTALVPAGPRGEAGLSEIYYLGVPPGATHFEDARAFLLYLVDAKQQLEFFDRFGWMSPRADFEASAAAFDRERYEGFFRMAGAVRPVPRHPQLDEARVLWREAFAQVAYEGRPAEEVLEALAPRMEALDR